MLDYFNITIWTKEFWIFILSIAVLVEVRVRIYELELIKKAMEKKDNGV
jgi:hypothetical protein